MPDDFDARYLSALQALLPGGKAWPRTLGATLTGLVSALALELARLERRAWQLFEEIDPRTMSELLGDWERVLDLEVGSTTAARRAAIHAKLLGYGTPTKAFFVALAASVGYTVTIQDKLYRPFTCVSPCNAALSQDGWCFVWQVTTSHGTDDALLESTIRDCTPAHTHVQFVYV